MIAVEVPSSWRSLAVKESERNASEGQLQVAERAQRGTQFHGLLAPESNIRMGLTRPAQRLIAGRLRPGPPLRCRRGAAELRPVEQAACWGAREICGSTRNPAEHVQSPGAGATPGSPQNLGSTWNPGLVGPGAWLPDLLK